MVIHKNTPATSQIIVYSPDLFNFNIFYLAVFASIYKEREINITIRRFYIRLKALVLFAMSVASYYLFKRIM